MRSGLPFRRGIIAASTTLAFGVAAFAGSPNPAVGAHISAQCAACHGSNGMSVDTSIPNLAGQHYVYLVQQLKAFKERSRISPLMNELARPLTQEQIEDISAYYASVPIEVGKPSKSKP
jgi:cytochrome c553